MFGIYWTHRLLGDAVLALILNVAAVLAILNVVWATRDARKQAARKRKI